MFNWFKKFRQIKKQEKKFNNYIFQHKAKMIKIFYQVIQWKECEWFAKDIHLLRDLWYRILEHDDSLYDKQEYKFFRAQYYPITPQEKIDNMKNFEKALKHHQENNDHHWQYRKDYTVLTTDVKMACIENILDWVARKKETYEKLYDKIDNIDIPSVQKEFMKEFLSIVEKNIQEDDSNDIPQKEK